MDTINDREFWKEFLGIYRSFSCLWDRKCIEYSDHRYRNVACAALVAKCKERFPKATRSMVMRKIHSFRCSFHRELKKVIKSRKNGVATYVPNLWYYELLSFIEDSLIIRGGAADSPQEDAEGNSSDQVRRKKRTFSHVGTRNSSQEPETAQRPKRPRTPPSNNQDQDETGFYLEEMIKKETPEAEEVMPEEHEELPPVCEAAQEACPVSDPQQEEHHMRMKTLIMKHQMKEEMWRREMQMREDEHTMKMRVLEAQLMYYQNAMGCTRMNIPDEPNVETINI